MSQQNIVLESLNERLTLLSMDTGHLVMALQAVQAQDPQSNGIINTVISALRGNADCMTDIAEQLDYLLTASQKGQAND